MLDDVKRIERRLKDIASTFGTASSEYNRQKAVIEQNFDRLSNNFPEIGAFWFLDKKSKRIRIDKQKLANFNKDFSAEVEDVLDKILQTQKNLGTAYAQALKYKSKGLVLTRSRDLNAQVKEQIRQMAYTAALLKNNSTDYYAMLKEIPDDNIRKAIESDWETMSQIKYKERDDDGLRQEMWDHIFEGIVNAMNGVQYESFRKHTETAIGEPTTIGEISGRVEF